MATKAELYKEAQILALEANPRQYIGNSPKHPPKGAVPVRVIGADKLPVFGHGEAYLFQFEDGSFALAPGPCQDHGEL